MKAYHVHDKENSGEEACHEIVFAENPAQAKYKSKAYWNGVPWTYISVKRAKEFDEYVGKAIPDLVYAQNGWYVECHSCRGLYATQIKDNRVYCYTCLEEMELNEEIQ